MKEIYLDNAATTKPLDSIKTLFEEYCNEEWHNPSALYAPAVAAAKRLDIAREAVKAGFGTRFDVLFTSSGTESDVTAILYGAKKRKTMHYISSEVEHAAVWESMMRLKNMGHDVDFVRPDRNGKIHTGDVAKLVREDTVLVSIMHVNNQTGAINDIAGIARSVKNKNPNALFHCDGVQAYMRQSVADPSLIDYYSISAHKIHGLKGTGALLYKKNSPLQPLIPGGGQESGRRSGTENTFGISAFAHAAGFFASNREPFANQLKMLKKSFLDALELLEDMEVISPPDGADHILCLSIEGVRGEVLLHALEEMKTYISTGSACTSKKGVSRSATGLGLTREEAEGVIRISFTPFNTIEDIEVAAQHIIRAAKQLRQFRRR